MNLLEQIPGLADEIEREELSWNVAFLPINESIAGFEAKPLTLRHVLILRAAKSPLLYGATPSPLDLVAFLWVVAPDYDPCGGSAKSCFLRRCRRAFIPPRPPLFKTRRAMAKWVKQVERAVTEAAKITDAAREYVTDSFADKPSGRRGNGYVATYYSDSAFICSYFAREFGWDDETTLDKPLKRLWQYFKEAQHRTDTKAPMFNRSGKVISDWLAKQNEARNS